MAKDRIDQLLDELKRASTTKERNDKFRACVSAIRELKIDKTGLRGRPINFKRIAGKGREGELPFRNRLSWLRTIPLGGDSCFIVLHAETGVYRENKKGRNSADLLGLVRSPVTTKFAVVELKYGPHGDHLLYAVAEGLKNIVLHFRGFERLRKGWEEWEEKDAATKMAWGEGNPLAKVKDKSIQLLIVGDHRWMEKQRELLNYLPSYFNGGNGVPKIEIAAYSARKGAKYNSKPYALLPLKRMK